MIAVLICAAPVGYDPAPHHCQPASIECQRAFASGKVQYRDDKGLIHLCPLSKAPPALRGDPPAPVTNDPETKDDEHE